MSRKAAVELSMNFMVIIILGIVILSMGIYFAARAFNAANKVAYSLDKQTEQHIWDLLDTGDPVVAPIYSADTLRGKTAVFWIGVRNIEYDSNFIVLIEDHVNVGGECDSSTLKVLLTAESDMHKTAVKKLKANTKDTFAIPITVPNTAKKNCEYAFNVKVYRCPEDTPDCLDPRIDYGSVQKLYVVVPS